MTEGPVNAAPTATAPWRWGPNPLLTAGAVAASILELTLLFYRKPLNPQKDEFLIAAIFCGVIFFWLSVVWLAWFCLKAIARLRHRVLRRACFGIFATASALLSCLYLACWASFLYTGVFPDTQMLAFLSSGSRSELRFMLSVIQQTLPNAHWYGAATVFAVALALPPGLKSLARNHWQPRYLPGQGAAAMLAWALTGLGCLFFIGMIQSVDDRQVRELAMLRIRTQMHPAVSLATSPAGAAYSEIPKELDLSLLRPIYEPPPPNQADMDRLSHGPNVLYLAVESLRSDMIGKEHDGQLVMPNLTALAAKSLQFTRAHSQATHTDYSITSFLSSLYPVRSLKHYHPSLEAGFPKRFIYDWLHRYGYTTAIITSDNTDWCNMYGLMWSDKLDTFFDSRNLPTTYTASLHGFAAKDEEPQSGRGATLDDEYTVAYANAWMADQVKSGKPFFLHTMFQQTHFAYLLPRDFAGPFQPSDMGFYVTFDAYSVENRPRVQNAYFNAARYVDNELGKMLAKLEELGQMDNTIIVLEGELGEGFLEHNMVTHSRLPYEEFSHIPMLVYLPPALAAKWHAPRQIDYPAEQIDLPPTICGLLGLPVPPEFQGIDLLSPDRPHLAERYTFTHVEAPGQASGECVVYAGRWKLISDRLSGLDYLFDIETDPAEKRDVKAAEPHMTARLREKLKLWRNSHLTYHQYNIYYEHYLQPRI
jgi:arylsulfatase A-like enzyme